MASSSGSEEVDRWSFHLAMALWLWQYLLVEMYGRLGMAQLQVAEVFTLWALGGVALAVLRRRLNVATRPTRLFLLLAFTASICDRVAGHGTVSAAAAWIPALTTCIFVWWWLGPRGKGHWALTRLAIVIFSSLFSVAPQALAWAQAPKISWLGTPVPGQPDSKDKVATIVLLLDELNASASQPFAEVLRKHDLQTQVVAVEATSDATLKVIPSMFTGLDFNQARACSTTAVCSGTHILDFAQIHVRRPDVDVVGFFHPYCAIQGLRSCHLSVVGIRLFRKDLWKCAMWRLRDWPPSTDRQLCERAYIRDWEELRSDQARALHSAPVWQTGGLLFAHILLPHPPGTMPGGTLRQHYAENLARALQLLESILTRVDRTPSMAVRVVIFSDHPLRPAQWCKEYWGYAIQGCHETATLDEKSVPVIIAARHLTGVVSIRNNKDIFALLHDLDWDG